MKHKLDCNMAFGRKDSSCPRCQELINGAPARKSWHKNYYDNEQRDTAAIKAHFAPGSPHSQGKCGPVCTAFDY